jgi:hypothetical protein
MNIHNAKYFLDEFKEIELIFYYIKFSTYELSII